MRVAAYLRCDTCGGAVGRGGAMYSCAPCDFDLCEACYPHPNPSRNPTLALALSLYPNPNPA